MQLMGFILREASRQGLFLYNNLPISEINNLRWYIYKLPLKKPVIKICDQQRVNENLYL